MIIRKIKRIDNKICIAMIFYTNDNKMGIGVNIMTLYNYWKHYLSF